ncbi:MAG TPA: sugar ABC transporter ATP-binding protein [Conexibacter sp.]|nr:sugar ABC transporter ATP-binding protein [Conexibacter sp.]
MTGIASSPASDVRTDVTGTPTLELRGLSKAFGGARALDGVDLTIAQGEVHGLLGENGSGKSTLIKVLAGFHVPDGGELSVHGSAVELPLQPGRFRELGFDFVHQDLGLITTLSVVENLRIGQIASSDQRFHISWREERRRARKLFADYGFSLDPGAQVSELRPVEQALLAIVRAIDNLRNRLGEGEEASKGLLILDEPTVFLPKSGTDQLFGLVREIVAGGSSVLFVSHHLDEVLEITDRITVLRDGRVVGTAITRQTDEGRLVEMIIGRALGILEPSGHDLSDKPVVAEIEHARGGLLEEASVSVREGEIVGLTGLVGSGFEDMPYVLFGAWSAESGKLTLHGTEHDLRKMAPWKAIRSGMALVPADRQRDASLPTLSITDNMTVNMLPRFYKKGLLRRREMHRATERLMTDFDVRPAMARLEYGSLSGGNQQKVLLAKWLDGRPKLLLLHEPTQGVDVGAREAIFNLIRDAAAEGMAVICASADYEQLAAICDRVFVLNRGVVTAELTGGEVTKERITERAYNSGAADRAALDV